MPVKRSGTPPRLVGRTSPVLVVDDNLDSTAGIARLLEMLGHEVHVAHDGIAAYRRGAPR